MGGDSIGTRRRVRSRAVTRDHGAESVEAGDRDVGVSEVGGPVELTPVDPHRAEPRLSAALDVGDGAVADEDRFAWFDSEFGAGRVEA